MSDSSWLSSPAMKTVLDELVCTTVKQYRIEPQMAEEILADALSANRRLRDLAATEDSVDRIRRTSVFKNAAAAGKRKVYHALRQYRQDEAKLARLIGRLSDLPANADERERSKLVNEICRSHVSTRERRPYATEFYEQLFQHLEDATTLIDIGCGLHPLQFPYTKAPRSLQRYVAFDSDAVSICATQTLATHQPSVQLLAFQYDLRDGWEDCCKQSGVERFDVALMLKLVPVIQRQARELLPTLAATPAKKWIVSGSIQSMTKRRDISRREEAVIRSFIESAKKDVVAEFTVGEEFVLVVDAA